MTKSMTGAEPFLVVANWKMHGSLQFARRWANAMAAAANTAPPPAKPGVTPRVRVAVCPPLVYVGALRALLPPAFELGAQNVAAIAADGAFTGEVSARMLADLGCRYVLVGHSERRQYQGETNADCAAKINAVLGGGGDSGTAGDGGDGGDDAAAATELRPILCVGESAKARQDGTAEDTVLRQLAESLASLTKSSDSGGGGENWRRLVVAYEPVWAIGSGKTPTADDITSMHEAIRAWLMQQSGAFGGKITLLYGGSVNADNAKALAANAAVNGFLVGGASLKPSVFNTICHLANAS